MLIQILQSISFHSETEDSTLSMTAVEKTENPAAAAFIPSRSFSNIDHDDNIIF